MDDIEPSAELFPNLSDADLQRVVECVFQDETGFGDPLGNGAEGFDIWNIINENSNPNSANPGTSESKRSPPAAQQYSAAKTSMQTQLTDPQNNRLTIDPYANGQWSCQTGPGGSSGNSSVSPSSSSWPQHTPPAPPSNGSTNNNNFVSPNQPIDRNQYPILRQHLKQEEPSDMQAYTMTTSQFRDQPTPQHWNPPPTAYPARSDSDAPSHKRSRTSDQYGSLSDLAHAIPQTPIPAAAALPIAGIGEDEDPRQRTIKFAPFAIDTWSTLLDGAQRPLPQLDVAVSADKGFTYSMVDGSFLNQKKNHFQITVHIRATQAERAQLVRDPSGRILPLHGYQLSFCGVNAEMHSSEIMICQSQANRKPVPHESVPLNIEPRQLTKVTVPRLQFSKTTLNNHRKNGRPNPDQKYFLLVVKLIAETPAGQVLIQAYHSNPVIVRATNPGQFETYDADAAWQSSDGVLHCGGPVAIGTDVAFPGAALTVAGNIVSTGQTTRPSDRRVKEDIVDVDPGDAMQRVNDMRIVEFSYKPEIAQEWGLSEEERRRVGVIAQELAEVLPDAVRDNGEFLTVDDARIFYDTVAAAQELYRLTGNLECKLGHVETISKKLAKFAHKRQQLGSVASGLSGLTAYINGAEDDAKCRSISGSLPSLASTAPSEDFGHSSPRRRKRHGREQWRSPNSTAIQRTIVALVGVMALCLVTMCTLYVIDWYNRTFPSPRQILVMPTADPDHIGHLTEENGRYDLLWLPPEQPRAPPIGNICGSALHCPVVCCGSHHGNSSLWPGERSKNAVMSRENAGGGSENGASVKFNAAVEITNMGTRLDDRYCLKDSCNSRKGHFDLFVPVSPHMPVIPLFLKIKSDGERRIESCGSLLFVAHETCNRDTAHDPDVIRIDDGLFELSVGNFAQAGYRFRVGYGDDLCGRSDSERGRSFDEYNTIFYRKCAASE